MKRANAIEKLLGGWAAGTLTEAERRALMEAALEDQALFDQLAGEQLLKETLEDPALRARIYAAAQEHRGGLWEAVWRRPWTWGVGMAAASVLIFSAVRWQQMAAYRAAPVQRAPMQAVEPAPPPAAPAATAAQERPRRAEAARDERRQPRQFDIATMRTKSEPAVLASPPALPAAPPPAEALRQSVLPRSSSELASAPPPASVPAQAPTAVADAARPAALGGPVGGVIGGIVSPRPSAERKEAAAKNAPEAGTRVLLETATHRAPLGLARVPAGAALALKYRILRRDKNGSYVQADPGNPFRPDDSLRLAFEVSDRAQVSIATPVGVLWTGTVNQRREETVSIPPGTARLVITASREDRRTLAPSAAPAAGEGARKAAGAVQVSRTAATPEGPVVAEITLKYE